MDSIKTNDIHNAEAEIPHLFQAQCASSKPGSYIAMQQLLSDTTGGNLSGDMQLPLRWQKALYYFFFFHTHTVVLPRPEKTLYCVQLVELPFKVTHPVCPTSIPACQIIPVIFTTATRGLRYRKVQMWSRGLLLKRPMPSFFTWGQSVLTQSLLRSNGQKSCFESSQAKGQLDFAINSELFLKESHWIMAEIATSCSGHLPVQHLCSTCRRGALRHCSRNAKSKRKSNPNDICSC